MRQGGHAPACSREGVIMRRRNGGAGVAPAPLSYADRGPGRPGFPSALTMKGRRLRAAGTVRMKGGESRLDHGDESPRFGPDKPVPGWKTPQVERRRAACLAKARGTARCQTEMVRHSALRSLTRVRGRKEGRRPGAVKQPRRDGARPRESWFKTGLFDT